VTSRCDLVVVGAGIIGAACAREAAAAGLKVVLVEPGLVGGGVTAAGMGHLVAVDGAPAELALAAASRAAWEAWKDLPGVQYSRCGTLWVAANDAERGLIPGMQARLGAAGIVTEELDAPGLYACEPALAPGLAGGLRVPSEGIVYPPAVAARLVEHAVRDGARLRRARAVALGDHEVRLDDGSRLAGHVLVATGCELPRLLPELPLRPRKGHLVITGRQRGMIRHQLVHLGYADSAHGEVDGVAFNVQPRPTGQLLIGSSREYGSTGTEVSLPMVRRMLECAFGFLPGLRDLQAIRIWAGLRPASADGLPYIGRVPARRGIWVAAGHEGHGVCTAPATARLLVDGLLGREPALDARPFDPARVVA